MNKKVYEKMKVIFSTIALALLFLLELYIMLTDHKNYVILASFALLMLIALYILVSTIINKQYSEMVVKKDQYENIFKSEKASYLLLRKSLSDMDERLTLIESNIQSMDKKIKNCDSSIEKMFYKLIEDQKKLAKITIGRNKENSDAMINAYELLKDKILGNDINLNDVKDELSSIKNNLMASVNKSSLEAAQENLGESVSLIDEEIKLSDELNTELFEDSKEEQLLEENVSIEQTVEHTNEELNLELSFEEEPMVEDMVSEEINDDNAGILSDSIKEQEMVEEQITEPNKKEKPLENLSDSNQMMTPDDIAALLANV